MKILMVCLGNICRSPLAEGILKEEFRKSAIQATVESAGFEPFHTGDHADPRAIDVARKHGIDITNHRARLFKTADFDTFDRIFVMDDTNFSDIHSVARNDQDMKKVDYILNVLSPGTNSELADPYYGSISGFEEVFCMLEKACHALAENISQKN